MQTQDFKKGKFYTLPIKDIRKEGKNSFFIVNANEREYAIRMFDFQKNDERIATMQELPCMVKDIHGDSIVFVQNFSRIFADRYITGDTYPFIVIKETHNEETEFRYYDITDNNRIPFKLKCDKDTILVPHQRIRCVVNRPSRDRMVLTLEKTKNDHKVNCITPAQLLEKCLTQPRCTRYLLKAFATGHRFAEARQHLQQGSAKWVVTAITSVDGVEQWANLSGESKALLLRCYRSICLYLLEDSDYLLQFNDSDRDNYQAWIADKVTMCDTCLECLTLISNGECGNEVDSILGKIRNSGYIYHPHRRMRLLITIFSLQPQMLEEKIDAILDLIDEGARGWKVDSFTDAFSSFLQFYVMTNREKTTREAVVDNQQSKRLLNRMVRSICYLLLMTNGEGINVPLYRSLLFHYLSFVKGRNVHGDTSHSGKTTETLVERAFSTLLLSEESGQGFTWGKDFKQTEILAYQMAATKPNTTTFLTRSFEAHNVRFTVSAEGITLARSTAADKEKNILPQGFPGWHNLQIYLGQPSKHTISKQADISRWRNYWTTVEQALFEEKDNTPKPKRQKMAPDVGTETQVRVLWKDDTHQGRYYCRIEDELYEGEGWIDTYQKKGSIGMFHFDPQLDIDSFQIDGKPILFRVKVNSVGSPKAERRTYTFNAISMIDEMIREQVKFSEEADCLIFHYDTNNDVLVGVTEYGYGIFLPTDSDYAHVNVGDSVRVKVTNTAKLGAIQGTIIGEANYEIDIKSAAEAVLHEYAHDLYEESEEELEEEAMSASEDLFDADYMKEIINIIDHKAVIEHDNTRAYALLSIAHILARMTDDKPMADYLEQRQQLLCILEDYGKNGKVNDDKLQTLADNNADMLERFPLLKQRLSEMRIVNCFGQQDSNEYLWTMAGNSESDSILSKLARLMLACNLTEGFGLQDQQRSIITKIKSLLNVNVELPQIYSFGEENQTTEFKTSIVFPPSSNMREDMKQQTFNIMKVICGMTNAYGGTLYLGVYDTGTAKGLADDLASFGNSKDKFDLYVRNQIRHALGDAVNASIAVDHPEAGKHWIYAIRVTPSKTPVMLRLDNRYYLREGTSTYPIELEELEEIMDDRNLRQYNTQAVSLEDIAIEPQAEEEEKKETAEQTKAIATTEQYTIATSRLRSNITENWVDGYGEDTACYLRVVQTGDWCMLDSIEWEDGIITLAIHNDELDGSLIIVYEDGCVNRVPIDQLTDKRRGSTYKMHGSKKPAFICPAHKDDALLTAYEDDKGKQYVRLDDIETIDEGKMISAGNKLSDVDFTRVFHCEIIAKAHHEDLKRMHNMKRTTLGFQALTAYGQREQEVLAKIGVSLK